MNPARMQKLVYQHICQPMRKCEGPDVGLTCIKYIYMDQITMQETKMAKGSHKQNIRHQLITLIWLDDSCMQQQHVLYSL